MNYPPIKVGIIAREKGMVVLQLESGVALHVYRLGRKWFYRRMFSAHTLGEVLAIHTSRPIYIKGWSNRAMALSAAQGNRLS